MQPCQEQHDKAIARIRDARSPIESFLAVLKDEDLAAVLSAGEVVTLKLRAKILRQDARVDAVYFPLTCMFSLLVTSGDKPQMELATIGRESVIGAAEALQSLGAMELSLVQIPRSALL